MDVVSAIVQVVKEIVKAARTARENRKSCLDLANHVGIVGDIVHHIDSSTDTESTISSGSGHTARVRKPSLESLKAALDEALQLVESQQQGGFGGRINKLITSGTTAKRFQRVKASITACVTVVGLAEQFNARYRAQRANKGTGSAPNHAPERHHPPPSQHQQSFLSTPGPSQQHQSPQPATSLLQPRRSPRLSQQNQSFQPEEQQRSSRYTPPPPQQQKNSQSAVRPPKQPPSSKRQHSDSQPASLHQHQSAQPAAPHHHRRSNGTGPFARAIVSAIEQQSSQPASPHHHRRSNRTHPFARAIAIAHQSSQPALPPRGPAAP